jgi:hypothetical protein
MPPGPLVALILHDCQLMSGTRARRSSYCIHSQNGLAVQMFRNIYKVSCRRELDTPVQSLLFIQRLLSTNYRYSTTSPKHILIKCPGTVVGYYFCIHLNNLIHCDADMSILKEPETECATYSEAAIRACAYVNEGLKKDEDKFPTNKKMALYKK